MPLELDPNTGEIRYQGQVVGQHRIENGKSTVRLSIQYEAEDDWALPLCWFAQGLSKLSENEPPTASLSIHTSESDTKSEPVAHRYLVEKEIKRDGNVWRFHKADADHWPSELHGHDYDKCEVLDAVTGQIYDSVTRDFCGRVNKKALSDIQSQLRNSQDFEDKVKSLIDQ